MIGSYSITKEAQMKRISAVLITAVALSISGWSLAYSQDIWVGKDGAIRNTDTRAFLVEGEGFYLATRNEIYKASDINTKWDSVFFLPRGANEINCLGGRSKNIFVGTKRGLFRSQDYGATWRNVFKTIIPDKNDIISIEVSRDDPRHVLIGTKSGVFISADSGERWLDLSGNLKSRSVKCLMLNKEVIYAGGDGGLYFKKEGSPSWERIFVKSAPEKSGDEGISDSVEAEDSPDAAVNCIAARDNRIYVGMDKKILYSEDDGRNWKAFPCEALTGLVNYILPSSKSGRLYCATTKGVFEFDRDKARWLELYRGIGKDVSVKAIHFDNGGENSIWAVTDKGIYRLESGRYMINQNEDIEKSLRTLKVTFDNEPAFKELQQAAIRFAEVSPEKIKNWRREARMRALFPTVSFGVDRDRSTTSEIYTSATKDYIVTGPDDVDSSWDVSISWDLGDIIFSDDQTNIDVRSRLMVQLRNDVLDDLRRAYYERKRVQFELSVEPPKDVKARFEKELRLQELTSAIDDLTGNYLSDRMREAQREEVI